MILKSSQRSVASSSHQTTQIVRLLVCCRIFTDHLNQKSIGTGDTGQQSNSYSNWGKINKIIFSFHSELPFHSPLSILYTHSVNDKCKATIDNTIHSYVDSLISPAPSDTSHLHCAISKAAACLMSACLVWSLLCRAPKSLDRYCIDIQYTVIRDSRLPKL